MLTAERHRRLHTAAVLLRKFDRNLPAILAELEDHRDTSAKAGGTGKGGHSDPTATSIAAALDAAAQMDEQIEVAEQAAVALDRILNRLLGPDRPPPSEVDADIDDVCQLHRLVGSHEPGRRNFTEPDGTTWRLCRWCGDFTDRTGRRPTVELEVRQHIAGQQASRRLRAS